MTAEVVGLDTQAQMEDVAKVAAPVFAIEAMEEERPTKRPSKAPAAADNVVKLSA